MLTKFVPPQRRGAVLWRERLLARLVAADARRLTLVAAPAGYGKTELMAQWYRALERQRVQVGWLSLEAADNDPTRFVLHLLAAVSGRRGRHAAVDGPGAAPAQSAEALSDRVLDLLARRKGRLFLFLDDLHLLTEPVPCAALSRVLMLAPADVRFVVASREAPPLALERLRARSELEELGWSDLILTPDEAAAFVEALAPDLPPSLVEAVVERAEGWAAGLQLASLFHKGRADSAGMLDRLHGGNRQIAGFLAEDVFARLPESVRSFLLCTSVLERLHPELCNALTGTSDGAAQLAELERRNLFIFALDGQGTWFRYHHLFVEFLRREAARCVPQQVPELHRRAAEWYAANGQFLDAIEHAFAAQDGEFAGDMLNRYCDVLMYSGHLSTLVRYAQRLHGTELRRWPRVQLDLAWAYGYERRFAGAREVLDGVRESYRRSPAARAPAERFLLRQRLLHREMMLAFMADDLVLAEQQCRQLQADRMRDDAYTRGSVLVVLVSICRFLLEPARAVEAGATARPLIEEARSGFGQVVLDSFLGPAHWLAGDVAPAERHLGLALERAESISGACSSLAAMPGALLAQVHYERGAMDEAQGLLERYARPVRECGFVDALVAYFSCALQLELASNRPCAAQERLREGLELAAAMGFERLRAVLLALAMRHYETVGDPAAAAGLLRLHARPGGVSVRGPSTRPSATEFALACVGARQALLAGRPAEAVPGMVRWRRVLELRGCVSYALHAGLLLARLHDAAGDARATQRELRPVLIAAQGFGVRRLLLDEGPALCRPLTQYLDAAAGLPGETPEFALALLDRLAAGRSPTPAVSAKERTPPAESLAAREVEILSLAGQGLRNQDIALALGLAENTVKWHLKHVYSKLAVGRRADAVRQARSAGLIR